MVPLTDIIRRLVEEFFDLRMADAAAVFGTPEAIQSMCTAAGFEHPVQVILQGYFAMTHLRCNNTRQCFADSMLLMRTVISCRHFCLLAGDFNRRAQSVQQYHTDTICRAHVQHDVCLSN